MILVRAVSVNMVHLLSARTIYQIGERILCAWSKSQHIAFPTQLPPAGFFVASLGDWPDLDGDQSAVVTTAIREHAVNDHSSYVAFRS
jgi:hypothetical protein